MNQNQPPRRDFLRYVGSLAAMSAPALAAAGEKDKVAFPPIYSKTEKPETAKPAADPKSERVGVAMPHSVFSLQVPDDRHVLGA